MVDKSKRKEGQIFTNSELSYIQNPKNIKWESRGTVKRKLRKKLLFLSKKEFIPAFYPLRLKKKIINLLSEKEKYDIAYNFFLTLRPPSIRKLIKKYTDFEKVRDQRLKTIKKWNEPKRLEKEKSRYEKNPFSSCVLFARMTKPVKNIQKFEKNLHTFLTSPESILSNKFTGDMRYICSSELTKEIYHKIKEYKKPIKIKNLLSNFKYKKEKEIIEQFYIKGILLENSISWDTFLELCRNLIKKGKFHKIPKEKSYWIEYDLDVFKITKDYKEKEVILPKIYENIDFEFYSPPDLKKIKS